jgi:hypothetical protein
MIDTAFLTALTAHVISMGLTGAIQEPINGYVFEHMIGGVPVKVVETPPDEGKNIGFFLTVRDSVFSYNIDIGGGPEMFFKTAVTVRDFKVERAGVNPVTDLTLIRMAM